MGGGGDVFWPAVLGVVVNGDELGFGKTPGVTGGGVQMYLT